MSVLFRLLVVLIACTAGCQSKTSDQKASPRSLPEPEYAYTCEGNFVFSAAIGSDTAFVFLPDTSLILLKTASASGVRYNSNGYTFWSKGDEAMLESEEENHRNCMEDPVQRTWEKSRLSGNEARAAGQEPGWYIEIDHENDLRVVADYGERTFTVPAPRPETLSTGVRYHTETDEHELEVVFKDSVCHDSMNGEEYPYTVLFTLDGQEYQGCGKLFQQN